MSKTNYSPEQQARYEENRRKMDAFISDAKTKIDISDVLTSDFGYTLWEDDPAHRGDRKSTSNARVYFKRTVDGGESFTEVVTVRKNASNGEYYYNNLQNTNDKGNIFSLAQKRLGLDFKSAQEVVRKWHDRFGSGLNPDITPVIQPEKPVDAQEEAVAHFKVRELYETSYLESRGLHRKTIDSENFKGKVFNTLRYIDRPTGAVYDNNIAFPYFSSASDRPIAVEVKNRGLSKFLAGSIARHGLWVSNLPKSGKVDNLVVVENPLNAMSMHQLAGNGKQELDYLNGKDNLYIATGGTYTKRKLEDIQYLIDTYKPKQLVIANDRANSGLRYDINLVGGLERVGGTPQSDNIMVEHNIAGKNAYLTVTASAGTTDVAMEILKPLQERFEKAYGGDVFEASLKKSGDHSAKLNVGYYNSYENNLFAYRQTEQAKGLENIVTISKPKTFGKDGKIVSDWNDVLMVEQGIDKSHVSRQFQGIDEMSKDDAAAYIDMQQVGKKLDVSKLEGGVFKNEQHQANGLAVDGADFDKLSRAFNEPYEAGSYMDYIRNLGHPHTIKGRTERLNMYDAGDNSWWARNGSNELEKLDQIVIELTATKEGELKYRELFDRAADAAGFHSKDFVIDEEFNVTETLTPYDIDVLNDIDDQLQDLENRGEKFISLRNADYKLDTYTDGEVETFHKNDHVLYGRDKSDFPSTRTTDWENPTNSIQEIVSGNRYEYFPIESVRKMVNDKRILLPWEAGYGLSVSRGELLEFRQGLINAKPAKSFQKNEMMTYQSFKERLLDEKNQVLKGEVPQNVERAYYAWQGEQAAKFSKSVEDGKVKISPVETQELNEYIKESIDKSGGAFRLKNEQTAENRRDLSSSNVREMADVDGSEKVVKENASKDNNQLDGFHNVLESSDQSHNINKWQGTENDANLNR